jgi:hypothetical protein
MKYTFMLTISNMATLLNLEVLCCKFNYLESINSGLLGCYAVSLGSIFLFIYLRSLQSVRRHSAIVVRGTVSDMQEIHTVKRLPC